MRTLFVCLFGGPGIGKSTRAASLFARLKRAGVEAEYVTEYAKELVWNGQIDALENQLTVLGEQWRRLSELDGKVEVVINDSPPLLCSIYAPPDYPPAFHDLVVWCQKSLVSQNFLLERMREDYSYSGRRESRIQAFALDDAIRQRCLSSGLDFITIGADDEGLECAFQSILDVLKSGETKA
jgi:hypothetical protein